MFLYYFVLFCCVVFVGVFVGFFIRFVVVVVVVVFRTTMSVLTSNSKTSIEYHDQQ